MRIFARVLTMGLFAATVAIPAGASVARIPIPTPRPDWRARSGGYSVAPAGDVNGDGYGDVISGQLSNDGAAFAHYGSAQGLRSVPDWQVLGDQEFLGKAVAGAGDVNGDGFDDVIVGAPNFNGGQSNEGKALLFLGSSTGLATQPSWVVQTDQAFAKFGESVSSAGDVNGDGYNDVMVGAPGYEPNGSVFVYLGSPDGPGLVADWSVAGDEHVGATFGNDVAAAGDVNGDGFDDVMLGASNYDAGKAYQGRAYVYVGSASGLAQEPIWIYDGDQPRAQFGFSIAGAGDVNADGFDDVLVGANGEDLGQVDEGAAYLFLGAEAGPRGAPDWIGQANQEFAYYGWAVAGGGDVNGDGYDDVVVGAAYYSNPEFREGGAFLYHGSPSGLTQQPKGTFESNADIVLLGSAVAVARDVNNDGYAEVVVGAWREGMVFAWYGPTP